MAAHGWLVGAVIAIWIVMMVTPIVWMLEAGWAALRIVDWVLDRIVDLGYGLIRRLAEWRRARGARRAWRIRRRLAVRDAVRRGSR